MSENNEITDIIEMITATVPVEKIYLFGSRAYGIPDENSDYDFFILIPDEGIKPIDAMQQVQKALILFGHKTPVDILADYQSRFNTRRYLNTLERKIADEGVIVFERT